jgi:5'-nucleotidase
MRILVTNDDGVFSPGLVALAKVAARFGQVRVVAPDVEQSATSHSITIDRPLRMNRAPLEDFVAFRVNGTPADCVALGLYRLEGADLVLSGINLGSNLGHEIWVSGTVAAARQAALLGVPGVAFSLVGGEIDEPKFEAVVPYVEHVIRLLQEEPGIPLVNVNLPAAPKGIRWTRQSVRTHVGRVVEGQDTFGRRNYWLAEAPLSDPDEGTDRWAVERGLVSLTPLRLDLTEAPPAGVRELGSVILPRREPASQDR